jgi:hypothetical protein
MGVSPVHKPTDPLATQHQEPAPAMKMGGLASLPIAEPPAWTVRAKPVGIARVPTHAVRPVSERRTYMRAKLSLTLQVKRIAGVRNGDCTNLRTTNISSSGLLFLCPQRIEPETPLEIEVCVLDRPFGRGSVRMLTEAHVVRAESASQPGWYSLAATFDDITFQRDEPLPSRFDER